MTSLTQSRLKEIFDYDQDVGVFKWKDRSSENFKSKHARGVMLRRAGTIAGYIAKQGKKTSEKFYEKEYRRIGVDGKLYFAHRLVWIFFHGSIPNTIDHINGDGLDNRIENLRDVSMSENQKNRKLSSNNTSGISGVSFQKSSKKWRVEIGNLKRGTGKNLGYFDNFLDACCARKSAEKQHGYLN